MAAQIYFLSPKGSAWLIYHRCWKLASSPTAAEKGGGVDPQTGRQNVSTNWAFVFNYETGLTAHEAWGKAQLAGNPPFCEVIVEQLEPYPNGRASVDTKGLNAKATMAFERLSILVQNNVNS